MPDIEFAFLADAAEARPGEKFSVLGGGVTQLGSAGFPFHHPHLALVIGLLVTAPEMHHQHEVRFVMLDPGGREIGAAGGSIEAHGGADVRDRVITFSIDLWNLGFDRPGEHSMRILVNGSERKRLPLLVEQLGGVEMPGSGGLDVPGAGGAPN